MTIEQIPDLLSEAWQARRTGDYSKTLELTQEAQSLCSEDEHFFLGRINHIYRQVEMDHDRYEQALPFAKKAIWHYRAARDAGKIAHSIRHLADLFVELERYEEAEQNYRSAIQLYVETEPSLLDRSNALRGFGILLVRINKNEEARKILSRAKEHYYHLGLSEGVEEMSDLLRSLGSNH